MKVIGFLLFTIMLSIFARSAPSDGVRKLQTSIVFLEREVPHFIVVERDGKRTVVIDDSLRMDP